MSLLNAFEQANTAGPQLPTTPMKMLPRESAPEVIRKEVYCKSSNSSGIVKRSFADESWYNNTDAAFGRILRRSVRPRTKV